MNKQKAQEAWDRGCTYQPTQQEMDEDMLEGVFPTILEKAASGDMNTVEVLTWLLWACRVRGHSFVLSYDPGKFIDMDTLAITNRPAGFKVEIGLLAFKGEGGQDVVFSDMATAMGAALRIFERLEAEERI
jgi:hypothetical protein